MRADLNVASQEPSTSPRHRSDGVFSEMIASSSHFIGRPMPILHAHRRRVDNRSAQSNELSFGPIVLRQVRCSRRPDQIGEVFVTGIIWAHPRRAMIERHIHSRREHFPCIVTTPVLALGDSANFLPVSHMAKMGLGPALKPAPQAEHPVSQFRLTARAAFPNIHPARIKLLRAGRPSFGARATPLPVGWVSLAAVNAYSDRRPRMVNLVSARRSIGGPLIRTWPTVDRRSGALARLAASPAKSTLDAMPFGVTISAHSNLVPPPVAALLKRKIVDQSDDASVLPKQDFLIVSWRELVSESSVHETTSTDIRAFRKDIIDGDLP